MVNHLFFLPIERWAGLYLQKEDRDFKDITMNIYKSFLNIRKKYIKCNKKPMEEKMIRVICQKCNREMREVNRRDVNNVFINFECGDCGHKTNVIIGF